MIGVYYGYGSRYEEIDPLGGPQQEYFNDGPDTLWVVKEGTSLVYVRSSRMGRDDDFAFDSSQTMHHNSSYSSAIISEARLTFLPAKDSVFYGYYFEEGNDHAIMSSFAGAR